MPGLGQPGCSFRYSEEIRAQWPWLDCLPRPEPRHPEERGYEILDRKLVDGYKVDHKKWLKEYNVWGALQCPNSQGYFCGQHGMWITCEEVRAKDRIGQTFWVLENWPTCPKAHYELEDLIAEFHRRHEDQINELSKQLDVHKGTAGAPRELGGRDDYCSGTADAPREWRDQDDYGPARDPRVSSSALSATQVQGQYGEEEDYPLEPLHVDERENYRLPLPPPKAHEAGDNQLGNRNIDKGKGPSKPKRSQVQAEDDKKHGKGSSRSSHHSSRKGPKEPRRNTHNAADLPHRPAILSSYQVDESTQFYSHEPPSYNNPHHSPHAENADMEGYEEWKGGYMDEFPELAGIDGASWEPEPELERDSRSSERRIARGEGRQKQKHKHSGGTR